MPTVTKMLGEGTQSVLLTVAILECLASAREPVSISELAKRIGTSKSRVFRHLRTLLACDYVTQDEAGGEYGIGPRLLALCRSAGGRQDLGKVATPFMERLSERFRHTVIVSKIEPDGIHVIKSISGHASIVLEVRPGTILPFDRSAQGRIALAFADRLPPECRQSAVLAARRELGKQEPGALAGIQQRGIATAQMRQGLMGIAAPIFEASGRVTGTLAFLNTSAEMNDRAAETALREAASAVSRELGYAGAQSVMT